jgi:hypothetical protein
MDSGKVAIHLCIQRFSDMAEEPYKMLMPISAYELMPLVPLAKAVKPIALLLPAIQSYAYTGKRRCEEPIKSIRT